MATAALGPYTLTRLLGSGGMADVWLGTTADGRRVAQGAKPLPQQEQCLQRGAALGTLV